MPEADRRLIESELGIPVLSSYQSCECLRIAYQCQRREGFHLYMDQVVVRVIDDRGKDVPAGQAGDIVISNLVNRATVLLNYRLGDRVMLGASPCPCGRSLPVLARIDGRSEDFLIRPDGERIHESVVLPVVYAVPGVLRIQLIQHALDRIVLNVEAAPQTDFGETSRTLARKIRALMRAEDVCRIEVHRVDDLCRPSGAKFQAVICQILASSGGDAREAG